MSNMSRVKTTLSIESDLLRAVEAEASRTGKRKSELVEEALRSYFGFAVVQGVWRRSDLSEEEALDLAYSELHESRK